MCTSHLRLDSYLNCLLLSRMLLSNSFVFSGEKSDIMEALIAMVVEDYLPFSIVDGSGFKKFVKSLNPSYVPPTRQV